MVLISLNWLHGRTSADAEVGRFAVVQSRSSTSMDVTSRICQVRTPPCPSSLPRLLAHASRVGPKVAATQRIKLRFPRRSQFGSRIVRRRTQPARHGWIRGRLGAWRNTVMEASFALVQENVFKPAHLHHKGNLPIAISPGSSAPTTTADATRGCADRPPVDHETMMTTTARSACVTDHCHQFVRQSRGSACQKLGSFCERLFRLKSGGRD